MRDWLEGRRRELEARQAVLHSEEFKALWDRIKDRTTYRVQFDNEALIQTCTEAIKDARTSEGK